MQGVLPGKRAQPTHLLKFRNRAFGFDTPGPGLEVEEMVATQVDSPVREKKRTIILNSSEPPALERKKRKSEGKEVNMPNRQKTKT